LKQLLLLLVLVPAQILQVRQAATRMIEELVPARKVLVQRRTQVQVQGPQAMALAL
jgi:hypothetical protein